MITRGKLHEYFRDYMKSVFKGTLPKEFEEGLGLELMRLTFMAGAKAHECLIRTPGERWKVAEELTHFHEEIIARCETRPAEGKQ